MEKVAATILVLCLIATSYSALAINLANCPTSCNRKTGAGCCRVMEWFKERGICLPKPGAFTAPPTTTTQSSGNSSTSTMTWGLGWDENCQALDGSCAQCLIPQMFTQFCNFSLLCLHIFPVLPQRTLLKPLNSWSGPAQSAPKILIEWKLTINHNHGWELLYSIMCKSAFDVVKFDIFV